jgi:hypothetical protein
MREIRTYVDAMRARVPGLSQGLPVVRNVLGEPVKRGMYGPEGSFLNAVNPIMIGTVSSDILKNEFGFLGYGFAPPAKKRMGVDLVQLELGDRLAYDVFAERVGQVVIAGRTLRQTLEGVVSTAQYQNISPLPTNAGTSERVVVLKRVIDRFRDFAFRELQREYPELQAAVVRSGLLQQAESETLLQRLSQQ